MKTKLTKILVLLVLGQALVHGETQRVSSNLENTLVSIDQVVQPEKAVKVFQNDRSYVKNRPVNLLAFVPALASSLGLDARQVKTALVDQKLPASSIVMAALESKQTGKPFSAQIPTRSPEQWVRRFEELNLSTAQVTKMVDEVYVNLSVASLDEMMNTSTARR